jgi:aspartate racemase
MKTIGLIGGTSWVSTVEYYKNINRLVNERLGKLNAARIILYSVNYQEFKDLADSNRWEEVGQYLSGIAKNLQAAGADCILLCANTMHMTAATIQQNIVIPLLHIAEATARNIQEQHTHTVGLLGTKFTMEKKFFTDILSVYGIQTLVPGNTDRDYLHDTIFNEFGKGIFNPATKKRYLEMITALKERGAAGIIFGCTEIPMLIQPSESPLPVFDTSLIHSAAAVDFALND